LSRGTRVAQTIKAKKTHKREKEVGFRKKKMRK